MPNHTQTNLNPDILNAAPWINPRPSFTSRFLEAAADYARVVSGAMLAALLCMAVYAWFHHTGESAPANDAWILSGSVALNVVLFTAVLLPKAAAWLGTNQVNTPKQPSKP